MRVEDGVGEGEGKRKKNPAQCSDLIEEEEEKMKWLHKMKRRRAVMRKW